jgi:hypothetical protein
MFKIAWEGIGFNGFKERKVGQNRLTSFHDFVNLITHKERVTGEDDLV